MITRLLPILAGITVLLACGLVHGVWTHRWLRSSVLDDASQRVQEVRSSFGGWTSTNVSVDSEPYQQARASGYWVRRYTKVGYPGSITAILMCGRAGHMSVHTPDVCYPGAGYEMVGTPARISVEGSSAEAVAEFWTARFRLATRPSASELRIFWSWSNGRGWQAPSSPRWAFGGEPFLYKLYVVIETSADSRLPTVAEEFLQGLIASTDALDGSKGR